MLNEFRRNKFHINWTIYLFGKYCGRLYTRVYVISTIGYRMVVYNCTEFAFYDHEQIVYYNCLQISISAKAIVSHNKYMWIIYVHIICIYNIQSCYKNYFFDSFVVDKFIFWTVSEKVMNKMILIKYVSTLFVSRSMLHSIIILIINQTNLTIFFSTHY